MLSIQITLYNALCIMINMEVCSFPPSTFTLRGRRVGHERTILFSFQLCEQQERELLRLRLSRVIMFTPNTNISTQDYNTDLNV